MSIWGRPVQLESAVDRRAFFKWVSARLGGYRNGALKVNGTTVTDSSTTYTYNEGNLYGSDIETLFALNGKYTSMVTPLFSSYEKNWGHSETSADGDCYEACIKYLAGTNTYTACVTPNDGKARTVVVRFYCTTSGYEGDKSGFKFTVDNDAQMTLNEMIDADVIEPIVILYSSADDSRVQFNDFLNVLRGGTINNTFPVGWFIFTLKAGHYLSGFTFYSAHSASTYSGSSSEAVTFTWFDRDLFWIESTLTPFDVGIDPIVERPTFTQQVQSNSSYWSWKGWGLYGPSGDGVSGVFQTPIPAGYTRMYIDVECPYQSSTWNMSKVCLCTSPTVTGYSMLENESNSLKVVRLTHYNGTAAALDNQSGVTFQIPHANIYSLSRQIVTVDISDVPAPFYLGLYRVQNLTNHYSIRFTKKPSYPEVGS